MSDYVIDGLGMIHHRANFEALRERLTPSWRAVLGPGRPFDLPGHRMEIVVDPTLPSGFFQLRTDKQRVGIWVDDPDGSLARWADDGGR